MVDVRDREALQAWLETQPRIVGSVIVSRVALRLLPLVVRFPETRDWPRERIQRDFQAPHLRACSSLRVAESSAGSLKAASSSIIFNTNAVIDIIPDKARFSVIFALQVAIANADGEMFSNIFASDVVQILTNIGDVYFNFGALEGDVVDVQNQNLDTKIKNKIILQRIRSVTNKRLWGAISIPTWIAEDWRQLSSEWGRRPPPGTASTNNWWVWTEWYQAILDGTLDDARAKLYGTVPDKLWKKGIEAVNAHIAAKLLQKDRPKPKRNLPSAYSFPVSPDGRLVAVKTTDAPVLPYPTSDADHKEQLAAAHTLVRRLLALMRDPATNLVRAGAYQTSLEEYAADLPTHIEGGSILLAETSIQVLRGYLELDEAMLPEAFKERLRGLLLHHQSLRVYYPSVGRYYDNIRTGRLTAPLPLDAINAVGRLVAENTPTLFDPSVGPALTPAPIVTPVADAPPPVAAQESRLPADPVAEVDPAKARTYSIAGTWNALYKGLLEGEKVHKGIEGWRKTASTMGEIIQAVSDYWPFK